MNEWKQAVARHHGMTEPARQFIKDAKHHVATYRAMRVADGNFQDSKDTAEQLVRLQSMLRGTGHSLLKADRQVESFAKQGWLLRPIDGVPPDFSDLGQTLMLVGFAIETVLEELQPDLEGRRGQNKHLSRNVLINSLKTAYAERFECEAKASDPAFAEILELLLSELGITHSNLARVLREATPPTH